MPARRGLPWVWGASAEEVERAYPADTVVAGASAAMTRAVPVRASAATTYRWLCQLRVAPHSYDLLDNLGRRSHRTPAPEAEDLAVGDRVVGSTRSPRCSRAARGAGSPPPRRAACSAAIGVTYAAESDGPATCRLVCRMTVRGRRPRAARRGDAAGLGDPVMLRKQLLTIAGLAEEHARSEQ